MSKNTCSIEISTVSLLSVTQTRWASRTYQILTFFSSFLLITTVLLVRGSALLVRDGFSSTGIPIVITHSWRHVIGQFVKVQTLPNRLVLDERHWRLVRTLVISNNLLPSMASCNREGSAVSPTRKWCEMGNSRRAQERSATIERE